MPKKEQQVAKKGFGVSAREMIGTMHAEYQDAESYDEFHDRMMSELESIETPTDAIPEILKNYIVTDEQEIQEREQNMKKLWDKMIKESTMRETGERTFVHPTNRFLALAQNYLESTESSYVFRNFERVMQEDAELRGERILKKRAQGSTLEQAEKTVDEEITSRLADRGNLLAFMSAEFLQVKPEDLRDLTDENLVENYEKYRYMHGLACEMKTMLRSKDFRFQPDDRKACEHMLDLYSELIEIENRIESMALPYYKLIDADRMTNDIASNQELYDWASEQSTEKNYFRTMGVCSLNRSIAVGTDRSAQNEDENLRENRREDLKKYLNDELGIKLEDVTGINLTGAEAEQKELDLKKGADIDYLYLGYTLKLVHGDSCYEISMDESTNAFTYKTAPETASLRTVDTLKKLGFDPEKVVYTDLEGNNLKPSEMDWNEYLSKNTVIATQDDKEVMLSVGENYKADYSYTPSAMVRKLDSLAEELGFYPTLASYKDKDGQLLDFSTDEARDYLAEGNPITVSDGELEATITLDGKLNAEVAANLAVIKAVLADKLEALKFSSDKVMLANADGKEISLDDEADMKYIRDGGTFTAVEGGRQVNLALDKAGAFKHEYTEYHNDNVKLDEKEKEVKEAASDMDQKMKDVRAAMNHEKIQAFTEQFKAADTFLLKFTGSRQFRRMREEFERYAEMSSRYSEKDLEDPRKRLELEKCTARLIMSAREYSKYKKHNNSGKPQEKLRMALADKIAYYGHLQLKDIDSYMALNKKIKGIDAEIKDLKAKIKDETPEVEKARQAQAEARERVHAGKESAFAKMEAMGLGGLLKEYQKAQELKNGAVKPPAPDQDNKLSDEDPQIKENQEKARNEFNQKGTSGLYKTMFWVNRTNENIDRMKNWTLKQFDSKNPECMYDKFNLKKTGEQLDKEGQKVFGKYLVNLTILKMVSSEQHAAFQKDEDDKKGSFEKMTENKKSLTELERRIRDTDAYKKTMKCLMTGEVKSFVKDEEKMNNLYKDIHSQMKTKLKADIEKRNKIKETVRNTKTLGKMAKKLGK